MSECDEVARGIAQFAPKFATMDEARCYVRHLMRTEGETLIDNIAWSLYRSQQRDA